MRLDLFVACCTLSLTACGAGENRLDPGDLELRDVLGVTPEVATSWDVEQRTAARGVIEAGLHASDAAPMHATLGPGAELGKALATADAERARRHVSALGVVTVAVDRGSVVATARHATLEPHANTPIAIATRSVAESIEPVGWGAKALDAHELEVIAELATDAGHHTGPLIVTPGPQLAVAAAYTPGEPARMVVNPVVLAVLEPTAPAVVAMQGTGGGPAITVAPPRVSAAAPGNPYSFYGSVAECATAQRLRCDACLKDSSCTPIIGASDGNAQCTQFAEQQDRGFSLVCINLALAIETVSTCTASAAPGCPRDIHASESLSALENNAIFLDDGTCAPQLDHCLGSLFGNWGTSTPPRDPSPTTGCGDTTCDPGDGCDALDGSSCDGGGCDDSSDTGDGCSSSDSSSSCDGGSCDDSGESSCDSSGDGCSGGDSGGCDSGGDCGGGGGDCSGGGGDCSSGGGDCNATRRGHGGGTPIAILWALLPIPFARRVKRRAERKRAREAVAS